MDLQGLIGFVVIMNVVWSTLVFHVSYEVNVRHNTKDFYSDVCASVVRRFTDESKSPGRRH